MINVTKTYLPPLEEYVKYLKDIWKTGWVTNHGPLVKELEQKLKKYLGVKHLFFVSNGTIALQIAIKALGLKGEIITTPFSYVATTSSIVWEGCKPVFVDIDPKTLNIDANKIEKSITECTSAILATHIYGNPCNIEKIESIAKQYNLKVIYDAAHTFGVRFRGKSLASFGNVSALSFHATKLFHTIEGGAIVCNDQALNDKIILYKAFGHKGDDYKSIGINGKNSEFHAAMGLCNLPRVNDFIAQRKIIANLYQSELHLLPIIFPKIPKGVEYNYSYFPILFRNEDELIKVKNYLEVNQVNTRRYFFPSLNKLPYLKSTADCPISEDIAQRVLCLPFYQQLATDQIVFICSLIKAVFKK